MSSNRFHKSKEAFDAETLLATGVPGNIITIEAASKAIGLPCDDSKQRGWQVMAACIPRIEKQLGLCWRWDRLARHWKCLTDTEKPSDMHGRIRRIQSHAKRNERILNTIDLAALPEPERKAAIVLGTVSSVVRMASTPRAVKTLEMFAGKTPEIPDESVLMRLFVRKES